MKKNPWIGNAWSADLLGLGSMNREKHEGDWEKYERRRRRRAFFGEDNEAIKDLQFHLGMIG